jgi:regulatory protein
MPALTEAALHEAALAHLARYAASAATLARVLERRVARWAHREAPEPEAVAAARAAVRAVVARLVAAGAVDDAAFAAARARRMLRAGRSPRMAAAQLAARGVAADTAARAIAAAGPDDVAGELAAAVAFLRRRRFGPFRIAPGSAEARTRELAALARAGFARAAARAALDMAPEAAEALLARLRQAGG